MRRVLIIEDMPDILSWLTGIAREAYPECDIDAVETLREGLKLCAEQVYDLALIDIVLPDGSGFKVVRELRASQPSTVCVVTTAMGDDANIVSALSAGAHGYLLKSQPADLLVRQLTQLAAGVPALSPPVARRIMDHFRLTGPCIEADARLTPRELEVLGMIAHGLRISDVARALGLAEGTIASHIKSIYRKLGISTRAEAALHASRMGLLSSGEQPSS